MLNYLMHCRNCGGFYEEDDSTVGPPDGFCSNYCVAVYVGRETERIVKKNGLTMEEYLQLQKEIKALPVIGRR